MEKNSQASNLLFDEQLALQIKYKQEDIDKRQSELNQEKRWIDAMTKMKCVHCGNEVPFKDIEYIQGMYYVSPYGCSEGDYWDYSDECTLRCVCGGDNRFYEKETYKRLSAVRGVFKRRGYNYKKYQGISGYANNIKWEENK